MWTTSIVTDCIRTEVAVMNIGSVFHYSTNSFQQDLCYWPINLLVEIFHGAKT